ncbi:MULTISPECIES: HemK2/MTQ2 family protein methyltransferase [unclassified Kitasatospora]|uniref:HemK2/MTQ2 family protein methyltransferase n=1 Tax=unclassified Kitasatospora TaxID=2633591 RepID=UPI001AE0C394|nr:HemK2/MTQ2 family protein methyltransferase [Kitasatospora sp. RG8]MBP0450634.1 methyltransferase [Kitasatospora sp. RG8]
MLLLRPPGVYPAQGDTALLVESLAREGPLRGARCLDLGTGSGAVALAAARLGARVTAVDVSWLALATAWANARLRLRRIRLRRGDLTGPVRDTLFDLVVSNPPYVPAAQAERPRRGVARAWDAGPDGRLLLDRICCEVPDLLAPGGVLLLVQSSLADVRATVRTLERVGLQAEVVARRRQDFGPVMSARAEWFESRGLIAPGVREEELAVVRGARPA